MGQDSRVCKYQGEEGERELGRCWFCNSQLKYLSQPAKRELGRDSLKVFWKALRLFCKYQGEEGERELGRDSLKVFWKALRLFKGPGVQRAIAPI